MWSSTTVSWSNPSSSLSLPKPLFTPVWPHEGPHLASGLPGYWLQRLIHKRQKTQAAGGTIWVWLPRRAVSRGGHSSSVLFLLRMFGRWQKWTLKRFNVASTLQRCCLFKIWSYNTRPDFQLTSSSQSKYYFFSLLADAHVNLRTPVPAKSKGLSHLKTLAA